MTSPCRDADKLAGGCCRAHRSPRCVCRERSAPGSQSTTAAFVWGLGKYLLQIEGSGMGHFRKKIASSRGISETLKPSPSSSCPFCPPEKGNRHHGSDEQMFGAK